MIKNISKQKSIGLILGFGTLIISLSNLFLLNKFSTINCNNSILFNFIFSLLFSISAFLTSIKDNKISKIYQVFIFFVISFYSSILNGPSDITSIVFFVYFLILLWTYYKFKIKVEFLFLITIFYALFITIIKILTSNFFTKLISNDSCVLNIDNNYIKLIISLIFFVSFIVMYFLLLWVTLGDELRMKIEKNEVMENELIKNEPYIWYGKNVAGVIHNIKNKLSPIYMILWDIKDNDKIDYNMRKFAETQINNSDGMINLLDQLLFIIKNKNIEEVKSSNINYLVLSVCEYFKSNLDFKNNINIEIINIGNDFIVEIKPFHFIQVLENIIKNSWDEIKNRDIKNIKIIVDSVNKYISISDNGFGVFGIEGEFDICKSNLFKIGKTTKQNGLGYGMFFVREYMEKNNLKCLIKSSKLGTDIKIIF